MAQLMSGLAAETWKAIGRGLRASGTHPRSMMRLQLAVPHVFICSLLRCPVLALRGPAVTTPSPLAWTGCARQGTDGRPCREHAPIECSQIAGSRCGPTRRSSPPGSANRGTCADSSPAGGGGYCQPVRCCPHRKLVRSPPAMWVCPRPVPGGRGGGGWSGGVRVSREWPSL